MSGGYISCGTFHGDDKSGSALQGVLEGLKALEDARYSEIVARLREELDQATGEVQIDVGTAAILAPAIRTYREAIEAELGGPRDPFEVAAEDAQKMNPIDAKWGAGLGWRYYCVVDLETALDVSAAEGEPVLIEFD